MNALTPSHRFPAASMRRISLFASLAGIILAAALVALPPAAHAAGLDVVGKSDLGGAGFNGEVATVGDTAIVGAGILPGGGTRQGFYNPTSCPGVNAKVVDLSTPSAPRVASHLDVPTGVTAFDVAALHVSTPSFTGDLAAVALVSCGAGAAIVERGVAYYDVTNPDDPEFLGRYRADEDDEDPLDPVCGSPTSKGERCASSQHQVKLVKRADGKVLSLSTEPFASPSGLPSGDLRIVDVTNPRRPTQVASYPNGAQQPPKFGANPYGYSNNGCRPFDAGYGPGTTPDGTKGLLAYLDQGLLTLDLTNPAAPSQLGQLDPYGDRRDFEGNAAYVDYASSGGREFALLGESDWVAPETRLKIASGATLPGGGFACEAMFTLFDPEDTAQIYRKAGSRVPATPLPPAEIVYVGRGCPGNPYINAADVAGKIVLRDRGNVFETGTAFCGFAQGTKKAQDLGALAVVTAQTDSARPQAFSPDGDPAGLTIPSVMMDKPDADALRTALCPTYTAPNPAGPGGTCSGGTTVTGSLVDSPDADGAWGALRRMDITNPSAPTAAGTYTTPRSQVFPPPDLGVYSAHHAVSRGDRAYAAWYSDGVRVLDIAGAGLTEVASFVPPDTPDPKGAIPSKAYVTGVDLTPTGDIVITDINSGLYVLRASNGGGSGSGPTQPGSASFTNCPALTANVIRGTSAADTIPGTPAGDRIFALAGDDKVDGFAGKDCIDLGSGTDRGQGGLGNDLMRGGLGNDAIFGGPGNDRTGGNSGSDRMTGGSGGDRISGGSSNDRINGNSGNDVLKGDSGRDLISGSFGGDRISGGSGNDRINGNSGNDVLNGSSGRDLIRGGSGRDRIGGGSGNDRINSRDRRRDRIDCGRGRDSVAADRLDRIARNCERVRRR